MRAFACLLILVSACSSPTDPATRASTIQFAGSVQHFNLEGGFWAVHADDGKTYDPMNGLPVEFRVENLRVRVTAKVRDDMGSVHMVGPIVEIVSIERN
jgi:hypothetical protein